MMLLGYGLSLIIGLVLGTLGGGGAILTIPLLVYVFGLGMKEAVPMSLVVVGLTSLLGVFRHRRAGNLDVRAAITFGPAAMIGAVLGTEAAFMVSARFQIVVFAVMLLLAAALMLRGRGSLGTAREGGARQPTVVLGVIGAGVGFLTGFVGVGGGFMYVPALTLLAGLEMHVAVGTSLALIVLSCASGVARYIGRIDLDWQLAATVTALALVGVALGTAVASRLPQQTLRRAFAIFLLAMGGFVLVKGEGKTPAGQPTGETVSERTSTTNHSSDLSDWRS